jgi:penicillin-binding protein 1A
MKGGFYMTDMINKGFGEENLTGISGESEPVQEPVSAPDEELSEPSFEETPEPAEGFAEEAEPAFEDASKPAEGFAEEAEPAFEDASKPAVGSEGDPNSEFYSEAVLPYSEGTEEWGAAYHASRDAEEGSTRVIPVEGKHEKRAEKGEDDMAKTKRIKEKKRAKREKGEGRIFKPRSTARPFVLSLLFDLLKILGICAVLAGVGFFGLVMGVAKAYVDTTPELDVTRLTRSERTSYIYDKNGDLITTFAGMEYRDWVDINDIPDMLKNALISVEDVRYYKHGGVDFKRLFSAVVNTFRNSRTHGGSTLTQQLIKNKILSNEQSYKRKIQEAYLAYELENVMSKDKILEAYMNDVFLGESNYGFASAAKDYFGKELSQLTIRECAMLAGMVQKPYYTNPRANTYSRFYEDGRNKMDVTDARTNTVLDAMYDAGYITHEQYLAAYAENVRIIEKSEKTQLYDMPYFVEYAIYDVITHMLAQRGLEDTKTNRTAIENELRTGGYHIYLTVDPDIQHTVQQTITDWASYPELQNPSAGRQIVTNSDGTTVEVLQPQASAVIVDHATGKLLAVIGGRQEPTVKKGLNRAYQSSMPVGSAIKPLSVYGPALDLGYSCGYTILNAEYPIEGYGGEKGYPALGSTRWVGMIPMRRGVASSLNIVAARTLFDCVTLEKSAEYLTLLGIKPSRINVDGPGLALGTTGITPIEMAAAYATIANGGVYNEPISFTVVLDKDMNVILDAKDVQKSYRVFEETTAYMLIDMLKDVVSYGTGTNARIPGVTVAGKTGTNDDYTSVYFAGFTGYYTGTIWIGHDLYSEKLASGSTGGNSAAPLWQAFMSKIHEGLPDKPIMDVSPVEIGLCQVTLCSVSGKLATEACMHDIDNPPITDWCAIENVPSEYCTMHCLVEACTESGELAGPNCPASCRYDKCLLLVPRESQLAYFKEYAPELLEGETWSNPFYTIFPNAVITSLDANRYHAWCLREGRVCSVHGSGSGQQPGSLDSLIADAAKLIQQVSSYLHEVQTLPDTDRANLENLIDELKEAVGTSSGDAIKAAMEKLRTNYQYLSSLYPLPVAQPTPTATPTPAPEPTEAPTPEPTPDPGGESKTTPEP